MKTTSTGYRLALLAAVISGFSIYVSGFAVRAIPDTTLYTTLKNAVAGVALLIPVVMLASRRRELSHLRPRDIGWLSALAVIGGSVPYVLFFKGLQLTTASTGSLLNHSQFLVVAVLAVPMLRERITGIAWAGLALLAAGTVVGTDLRTLRLDEGAVLILASTVLFGAGVVVTRHLLGHLAPETVMAAKMSAGAVLLAVYAAATGHLAGAPALSATQWVIAGGTGLILLAFTVATTYALREAPALSVTAIGMASAPITLVLQLAGGAVPRMSGAGAWSLALVVAGAIVFLATRGRRMPGTVRA